MEEKKIALKFSKSLLENNDDTDLTKTLSNFISSGVGFHHAGLSLSSREIVEKAFKSGIIKALFATPTLAAVLIFLLEELLLQVFQDMIFDMVHLFQ